jgi:hypothetical protein
MSIRPLSLLAAVHQKPQAEGAHIQWAVLLHTPNVCRIIPCPLVRELVLQMLLLKDGMYKSGEKIKERSKAKLSKHKHCFPILCYCNSRGLHTRRCRCWLWTYTHHCRSVRHAYRSRCIAIICQGVHALNDLNNPNNI